MAVQTASVAGRNGGGGGGGGRGGGGGPIGQTAPPHEAHDVAEVEQNDEMAARCVHGVAQSCERQQLRAWAWWAIVAKRRWWCLNKPSLLVTETGANEAGPCRFGIQGIDGGRRLPYDVSRHVFGVTEEPRTLSALPCAGLHYSETSRAPSQLPVPRSVSSQLRYGAARPGTVVPATAATARGSIRASRGMVRRSCRRLRRASTRTHTLM